jgi:hypothetical protein
MNTPDKNLTPLQKRKKRSMSVENVGGAPVRPNLPRSNSAGEQGAEFDTSTSTGDALRDRQLFANSQRRLSVKIRTRKLLHSTSAKKEARAKAGKDIAIRLERLSMGSLDMGDEEAGGGKKEGKEEDIHPGGLEAGDPLLNKNFSHYACEVPLDHEPKPKPLLSSQSGLEIKIKSPPPRNRSKGGKSGSSDPNSPSPTGVEARLSEGGEGAEDGKEVEEKVEEEVKPPPPPLPPMSEAGKARIEAARQKRLEAEAAKPKEVKADYKEYLSAVASPKKPKARKPADKTGR